MPEWIKRNPVEAVFILSIVMMFVFLFPAVYMVPRDKTAGQILEYYLARIAVYSPVIAGVWITWLNREGKQQVSAVSRLKVFIPAWLTSVIIHTMNLKLTALPEASLVALIIFSLPVSLLPAWIITLAFSGTGRLKNMLASLVRLKGNFINYFIALLTFPVVHVIGSAITNLINNQPIFPSFSAGRNLFYTVLVNFLFVLFFAGGLNEEAGWRGFAQKRLQTRYSPIIVVFILWFLMVIWHIPNDLVQYQNGGYLMVRIFIYPVITVLFSWIYNRTGGSVLAVAIFHASMNSMNPLMGTFPITTARNILLLIFTVTVVFADRMWQLLPKDHQAVFQDV